MAALCRVRNELNAVSAQWRPRPLALACRLAFAGLLAAPMSHALAVCNATTEATLNACITSGDPDIQLGANIQVGDGTSGLGTNAVAAGRTITTNGFSVTKAGGAGTGFIYLTGGNVLGNANTTIGKILLGGAGSNLTANTGSVVTVNDLLTFQSDGVLGTAGQNGTILLTGSGAAGTNTNIRLAGGTLQNGASGGIGGITLNAASVTVDSGATLDFNNLNGDIKKLLGAGTVTTGTAGGNNINLYNGSNFSGVITGAGNLTAAANATVTLTGANTYTGTTTINSGATLILGTGGTGGSLGSGNIVNNGNLTINHSDTVALSNVISGSGSFTQAGANTVVFQSANTYTGTTTINTGATLALFDGATLGTGAVTANGRLYYQTSSNYTVGNDISGAGDWLIRNTGNTLTYTGNAELPVLYVAEGTLQVGNGGTSGSLGSGSVINNSALVYNRSDTTTVANAISGIGTLTQAGTGTAILTGNNTYSGATTISSGTLQVGNGGTTGTLGSGAVTNNGALVFNRSDALAVGNNISGTGSLTQAGTGTTTLTGTNTYTGGTRLNAGTIEINNSGALGTGGTLAFAGGKLLASSTATLTHASTFAAGTSSTVSAATGSTLTMNGAISLGLNAQMHIGSGADTGTVVIKDGSINSLSSGASLWIDGGTLLGDGTGANTLSFLTNQSSATHVAAGATLDFNGSDSAIGNLQGAGNVRNEGATTYVQSGDFSGKITGSTGLTKNNVTTLILSGANDYTGITVISGGTLQVGNGGATGTLGTGAVTNNGTLAVNRGGTYILANDISGTGNLIDQGSGSIILTGNNTYTGTTTIGAGSFLQVGNGDAVGTLGSGSVTNSGVLKFARNNTYTVSNVISGAGEVRQSGSGTTILTGANAYTGITNVEAGTLQAGAANVFSANSATTVSSGGTLDLNGFNQSIGSLAGAGRVSMAGATLTAGADNTSTTFSGTLSGDTASTLIKAGSGTLTLSGTATPFAGSVTINAGTLAAWAGTVDSLSSTGGFTIASGATLDLSHNGSQVAAVMGSGTVNLGSQTMVYTGVRASTWGGVITGTGGVDVNQGGFALTWTGANNYSGATLLNNGTLTAGAANTLSANSAVTVSAAGTRLDLNGFNQTIASLAGTNANSVVALGSATLTTGGSNASTSYAGKFTGSGTLTKSGTGTFTLTGDSSAFAGSTNVAAGSLLVNGLMSNAAFVVGNGALLGGGGTVGATTVASGGVLAPGNSIGTLTVNGDLTFANGSIFRVETSPTAADRVNTVGAGNININGGTVDVQAGGTAYARNTTYTILNAAGARTGTFTGATSNLVFLTPTLSYDANNVYLLLANANAPATYGSVATTANQANVANYLSSFANNPGNAQAQALIQRIDNLTDPNQARLAFTSMSGAQHAGASQVGQAMTGAFGNALNGHINGAGGDGSSFNGVGSIKGSAFALSSPATLWGVSGDTPAQMAAMFASSGANVGAASTLNGVTMGSNAGASSTDGTGSNLGLRDTGRAAAGEAGFSRGTWGNNVAGQNGLWGQALGAGGKTRSDGNGAGTDYRAGGFLVGYDKSLSTNWLVGVAGGYSRANWDASINGVAPASGKVETPQGAVYARYSSGPVMLSFAGSYADQKFSTNRTVTIGTANSVAASEHHGQEWGLNVQAEYALAAGSWQLRPLAGLRYAHLREDGFTETGATPGANLSVDARTTENTTVSTGLRVLRAFNQSAPGNGGFELRAIYSHLFGNNDSPITARLAGQSASFTATGTPLKRDAITLGAGVATKLGRGFTGFIDASYEARGSGQNAYAIGAGAKYQW